MNTVIWRIEYISCEGNFRWFTVETHEDVTEEQIEAEISCSSGMGDDPSEFLSADQTGGDGDGSEEDWTHIEPY